MSKKRINYSSKFFEKIWNEIDVIHSFNEPDVSVKNRVYCLVDKLQEISTENELDESEWHCLMGYIGYHFNDILCNKINAIKHLKNAIKHNPHNVVALLYCGYLNFDNHKWSQALNVFDSIPKTSFDALVNPLKYRILELKLCCKIRLEKSNYSPDEFFQILDNLQKIDIDRLEQPLELKKTIQDSRSLSPDIKKEALSKIQNIW
jgi:hypothetical protein